MILIDFDGVIINTIAEFVTLNNKLNNLNEDWRDTKDWNFYPNCQNLSIDEIGWMFEHKKLYKNPLVYDSAFEVMRYLNKKYKLAICTIGTNKNIRNKLKMLEIWLPEITVIPIIKNDNMVGKDNIICDIMLDDHMRNLQSPNCKLPILFEPLNRMNWNNNWNGEVVNNWLKFKERVEEFYGK